MIYITHTKLSHLLLEELAQLRIELFRLGYCVHFYPNIPDQI